MTRGTKIGGAAVLIASSLLAACAKPTPDLSIDPVPRNGVLRTTTAITGLARDKLGIRSVVLYVDGKRAAQASLKGSADSKWLATIDPAKFPPGMHYLTAMATANNGAFTEQTVTVVVAR